MFKNMSDMVCTPFDIILSDDRVVSVCGFGRTDESHTRLTTPVL